MRQEGSSVEHAGGTFRDPAGSLEFDGQTALRRIRPAYAEQTLEFLNHPLAKSLVAEGRLIGSEMLEPWRHGDAGHRVRSEEMPGQLLLRHPRIAFISYPWEWPPKLWLSAAELTLDLAIDLLPEDWILKDATPLNVLFEGTRPVFVDVLSIERSRLARPIWPAYGQFVRTFLLPLLAHVRLGWPLHAVLMRRDGYEPEEIFAALSSRDKWRQPALSAVTLPTLLGRRVSAANETRSRQGLSDPELTRYVLLKTFRGLRKQIRRLAPGQRSSRWSDYTETAAHYNERDQAAKKEFVASTLARSKPARLLDVGCNTGVYARLAAEAGASVVAIDVDLQSVERLAVSLAGSGLDILPLCVDLAQPSPATGWDNGESASFLSRCRGHFDSVLMLAVLHHLLIGSQIPLDRIASLSASLTSSSLVIEWVPFDDPKFQQLLRGRGELYAHLTEAAMRTAFAVYFRFECETRLENGRALAHLVKKVA